MALALPGRRLQARRRRAHRAISQEVVRQRQRRVQASWVESRNPVPRLRTDKYRHRRLRTLVAYPALGHADHSTRNYRALIR